MTRGLITTVEGRKNMYAEWMDVVCHSIALHYISLHNYVSKSVSELTLFQASEGKFNVTNFEERKEGRLVDALDWIELMKQNRMDGMAWIGLDWKGSGEEGRQEGKIDTVGDG